jgi:UDP-N-acetyl-D-glucosamine/UDP-N-acetyl-D-galactosamine dehydrogenase
MSDLCVAVVGLGYVGLPVAVAFGQRGVPTIGFDINVKKIAELKKGIDSMGEVTTDSLNATTGLTLTDNPTELKKANFIIVAVPTPITKANKPDLTLIEKASIVIGQNLSKKTVVVYESTVYPGVTEEICIPLLEKESGFTSKKDFTVGYSPERINPGDKEHTLDKIVKVVAGQNKATTTRMTEVYSIVCDAGVYPAASIKTAEAAKVIENTQRDLNIALINELSLIFHRLDIDTSEVLAAAGTKWNFLQFTPGLVGGHCIGVDPYYLVHKAEELGYHPQVIAAGRRVNDYMPEFVAQETIAGLIKAGKIIQRSRVLVMGVTFKENVKDIRNSKIGGTIERLTELGIHVTAFDPLLTSEEIRREFSLSAIDSLEGRYDAVIIATPHTQFKGLEETIFTMLRLPGVVVDIKKFFPGLNKRKDIIYKSL